MKRAIVSFIATETFILVRVWFFSNSANFLTIIKRSAFTTTTNTEQRRERNLAPCLFLKFSYCASTSFSEPAVTVVSFSACSAARSLSWSFYNTLRIETAPKHTSTKIKVKKLERVILTILAQ
jgi:hypothetical protein